MRKSTKLMAMLLSTVCVAVSLFPITSNAGFSTTTIDNQSFAETLDNTIWNNPEEDIVLDNGKMIFPAESTGDTRIISKNAVSVSKLVDNVFHAEYTMKAIQIPSGQEFVLACGIRGIESSIGEEGSVEVALTNDGGIQALVRAYESDEATVLQEAQKIGASLGGSFKVELTLSTKQNYTVKINNKTIYDGEIPVNGKGRIGFLQTGGCHIEISDLNIKTYSYDTPENTNIVEGFDNNTFDTSVLTSTMIHDFGYFPCSVSVEKYNDNDVLMFQNSGLAYLATKHKYSNFEMSFDVPYLQRTDIYNEDYTLQTPRSTWFGISFGDEYVTSSGYDYDWTSPETIYFNEFSQVRSLKWKKEVLAELSNMGYAYAQEGETRGFSIKLSVIDAHVTVGIKWMDEENFTTVAEMDTPDGKTPLGYIHIWGSEPNNFAIDNLVITNLDKNANIIETEYQAGAIEISENHTYEAEKLVYNNQADEAGFNWYLLIPCAVGVSILFVLVSFIIVKARTRKEKGSNEE